MNTAPATPFILPDSAPELARRFAMIMAGLAALVARRFLRMPHLMGLTVLLYSRLSRAVRRFHRALTRMPAQARVARVRAERADVARARSMALPSGRGWIVRELGWEAAAFMAQLEALLTEVATRSALDRAPGAARILRPICKMLAVDKSLTPVLVRPVPAQPVPVWASADPTGLPGVVGDCEVLATCC